MKLNFGIGDILIAIGLVGVVGFSIYGIMDAQRKADICVEQGGRHTGEVMEFRGTVQGEAATYAALRSSSKWCAALCARGKSGRQETAGCPLACGSFSGSRPGNAGHKPTKPAACGLFHAHCATNRQFRHSYSPARLPDGPSTTTSRVDGR